MADKQKIIFGFIREGKSIRSIARETGFHRDTVRKYAYNYCDLLQKKIKSGLVAPDELIDDLVETPQYDTSTRKSRKITSEMEAEVQYFLEENAKKRSRGEHKQQYRKKDIHEELLNKGYDIGYTAICRLINRLLDRSSETFIKQAYQPGEICEFDWGEVKLTLGSEHRKVNMAVFTTAYEGWVYARVFLKQKTRDFQEAHACYFDKIKGVHRQFVYDNMRTAVKRFVGRTEKEPTDELLKLATFYNFDFRFCNIASGNEKGHVEKGVGYIRQKAFSRKSSFISIDEINQYLEQICDRLNNMPKKEKQSRTANDLLQIARASLFPVQARFDCSDYRECRVDKLSTICVESCHYSVPDKYNGKIVQAKITTSKVICYVNNQVICRHHKLAGKFKWSMQIEHYLKTLIRKPGAFKGSVACQQMNEELKAIYLRHFKNVEKDFIRLMIYMKEHQLSIYEIKIMIEKLERLSLGSVNLENIIALLERDVEPKQEYPNNNINESVNRQLKEFADLLPGSSEIYEGGKIL